MLVTRYMLMCLSAVTALFMIPLLLSSTEYSNIFLFFAFMFFVTNFFYILVTNPSMTTSDLLKRVSSVFAYFSVELQYKSDEAKLREIEMEELRLSEIEHNKRKLQVAKDILQSFGLKPLSGRRDESHTLLFAHQIRSKSGGSTLSMPLGMETIRPISENDSVAKLPQPIVAVSPAPATNALS